MDRAPGTGVSGALSYFRMTLVEGVGPRLGRALRLGSRWFDSWVGVSREEIAAFISSDIFRH